MRHLKLIAAAAMILLAAGAAQAITFTHPYIGPVTFKLSNWDMGTIYPATAEPDNTTIDGIDNVNAIPGQVPPPGEPFNAFTGQPTTPTDPNREDGWGVFKITTIYNTNNSADVLWTDGQDGNELTGMFYGLIDNAVRFSSDLPAKTAIQSQNITFTIYENSFGTFASAGGEQQGSGGRTGFPTYDGITGGTLILKGISVQGDLQNLTGSTGPAEFHSFFNPDQTLTTGSGTFVSRIDLLPGTRDYTQFNSDAFPGGVDFQLNGTTESNGNPIVGDWSVRSQDPLQGEVIPEPLTMLALGLGSTGLFGYIRRRLA